MSRSVLRGVVAAGIAIVVYAITVAFASLHLPSREPATGQMAESIARTAPIPIPSGKGKLGSRSGFVHPGVLVTTQQLDFVAGKIKIGAQPWRSAFEAMRKSPFANLSWKPRPRPTVDCGAASQPDLGCKEEHDDAVAAYTHALVWYFTRDRRYAEKSIEILDAWSAVVRRHTNVNAPLQAAWSAASFVRAAELIQHTYPGWDPMRERRAADMFRTVYLPMVIGGSVHTGGNWELIMMDAAIGIAVFLDDRGTFNAAVAKWRTRLRAYIYLTSDGPLPNGPPGGARTREEIIRYWFGQSRFVDGLAQETCRDFAHTGWGLAAAAHVAETARIQGLDLYAEARQRLTKALEFHSAFSLGKPVPPWLCGGTIRGGLDPMPEVAYNHYAARLGVTLPATKKLIEANRPEGADFFYGWETLTHARQKPALTPLG